jgi:type I restriction enzyme M protein
VDEVDAEKIKGDKRLPFGLSGVNKDKKVSNANYLWLSYFYSYLNKDGRAGVVMSSQASSAGRDEAAVRQGLVATGAVDVMIDIRSNFFYTRTVPCQLWFFDRAKERDEKRRDQVLMLDARNIYRKVSRSICDFSPEQQKNIAAIIWLYRGQADRFLELVDSYLDEAVAEGKAAAPLLGTFEDALGSLVGLLQAFAVQVRNPDPLADTWKELLALQGALTSDAEAFNAEAAARAKDWAEAPRTNAELNKVRKALQPLAERCRDLTKQIDLGARLASGVTDTAVKDLGARDSELWDKPEITRARKALEAARAEVAEALRKPRYFVKQADWLQERFPDGKLCDVQGLVKLVHRSEIEQNDGSLTPGRYVGVAPEELDEDFDFEEVLRAIHIDQKGLNEEAAELAARIASNFEALGA